MYRTETTALSSLPTNAPEPVRGSAGGFTSTVVYNTTTWNITRLIAQLQSTSSSSPSRLVPVDSGHDDGLYNLAYQPHMVLEDYWMEYVEWTMHQGTMPQQLVWWSWDLHRPMKRLELYRTLLSTLSFGCSNSDCWTLWQRQLVKTAEYGHNRHEGGVTLAREREHLSKRNTTSSKTDY